MKAWHDKFNESSNKYEGLEKQRKKAIKNRDYSKAIDLRLKMARVELDTNKYYNNVMNYGFKKLKPRKQLIEDLTQTEDQKRKRKHKKRNR